MRDKHIIWREVDQIERAKGHGVELWYEVQKGHGRKEAGKDFETGKILVAFINEYRWYHGSDEPVIVETLRPDSAEFVRRQLDGEKVVGKAWMLILRCFRSKKLPPNDVPLGDHFRAWLNA